MTSPKEINVCCPQCKVRISYSKANPFRPFCSQNCQIIDLGAWATEDYCIPIQHHGRQNQFDIEFSETMDQNGNHQNEFGSARPSTLSCKTDLN